MINQLIKESTFNPLDPFDIKKDIFPNKFKKMSGYNKFLENFYRHWFLWSFNGEFESTIVYSGIIDRMKNGKYANYLSDFSANDLTHLYNYFTKMISEEVEHTDHFLNFINTIYGDSVISDDMLESACKDAQYRVENTEFTELLLFYYIGECYLWVCFYQIYKKTVDPDSRKIFKKLLVEEAQHNNNHYKIMKKIKNKITVDSLSYFIDWSRRLRYFGMEFVKIEFKLNDNDTKKDHQILELIYNSQWHREFNQLLIKKWYQLSRILYPNISIEEFTVMINHNDGKWSSLPLPNSEL